MSDGYMCSDYMKLLRLFIETEIDVEEKILDQKILKNDNSYKFNIKLQQILEKKLQDILLAESKIMNSCGIREDRKKSLKQKILREKFRNEINEIVIFDKRNFKKILENFKSSVERYITSYNTNSTFLQPTEITKYYKEFIDEIVETNGKIIQPKTIKNNIDNSKLFTFVQNSGVNYDIINQLKPEHINLYNAYDGIMTKLK